VGKEKEKEEVEEGLIRSGSLMLLVRASLSR